MSAYDPCPACDESHDRITWLSLGMLCAKCEKHTGNNNQGHYWGWCKVTGTVREMHFCCPGACALEADQ